MKRRTPLAVCIEDVDNAMLADLDHEDVPGLAHPIERVCDTLATMLDVIPVIRAGHGEEAVLF
jgi:hypothetical protein